ncbi:MAG: hypothetical protein CSA72_08660 [Rhodobacterales bacterium]|nr:MAG: hypothetical protein CSA72_08660 [Rhodobacterales bacterium]
MSVISPFEGDWILERVVDDRRAGQTSRFEGRAEVKLEGSGAVLLESGRWVDGPYRGLGGERRYLWQADGARIAVLFDDGRPFHVWDPAQGGDCVPHWCDPDTYEGHYDLALPDHWRVTWQVRGPAKDYRMETLYRR